MDIGNSHGVTSYGWVVDPSLNEGNAGFNFGSWVFPQDGQERLNGEAIGPTRKIINTSNDKNKNQ